MTSDARARRDDFVASASAGSYIQLHAPRIYEMLTEVAAARLTVAYSELAESIGLDMSNPDHRFQMGEMLDEVNREEHRAGRPMISAVVVHAQEGLPGAGFFECAPTLSMLTTGARQVELAFFVEELRRVHDYWAHKAHSDKSAD